MRSTGESLCFLSAIKWYCFRTDVAVSSILICVNVLAVPVRRQTENVNGAHFRCANALLNENKNAWLRFRSHSNHLSNEPITTKLVAHLSIDLAVARVQRTPMQPQPKIDFGGKRRKKKVAKTIVCEFTSLKVNCFVTLNARTQQMMVFGSRCCKIPIIFNAKQTQEIRTPTYSHSLCTLCIFFSGISLCWLFLYLCIHSIRKY